MFLKRLPVALHLKFGKLRMFQQEKTKTYFKLVAYTPEKGRYVSIFDGRS